MTKKSLEEMLMEHAERAHLTGRWAAFLSVWDEVQESYARGWKYKEIWAVLNKEGLFEHPYSTFMACIKRIKDRQKEVVAAGVVKPAPRSAKTPAPPKPSATPGSNRVDLPVFGEGVRERDSRRF